MIKLSGDQIRWLRMKSQRLDPDTQIGGNPEAVLKAVIGLQAQDLPSARLGLRVRSRGLTDAQVGQALQEPGRLAVAWTLRGTLHLHSAEDLAWLLPVLGPTFEAADERRMRALGWDEPTAGRGLDRLRRRLYSAGELTRPEIIQQLAEAGLPSEGQAPIHLIARAALQGWLCHGPQQNGEQTYTLTEGWIGPLQPLPHPQALGKLARRYLQAYGPATPADMAAWCGLKAADVRLAWEGISAQVVELEAGGGSAWLMKSQLAWLDEPLPDEPVVRLLPRFDALLLGYTGRDWLVNPAYARRVHPGGGMLRAVLLVDGQARGTWKTRSLKSGLRVEVEPFEPLPQDWLPMLTAEAQDLGHFLGRAITIAGEEHLSS